MKNLEIEEINGLCELSKAETIQIIGGTSFWYDVAYFVGAVVRGAEIFATEGGRSAGICVR